ncbi:hypothetical protein CCR75_001917 [Bremia lactucae]|uniref:J domain-containing protein n=1 Tax=Bremia lactucae TaxID=4779 RepID=A0A976ID65_BRELC|nr:hypothetical protein CCR75_001917 [Bremia lactucae]
MKKFQSRCGTKLSDKDMEHHREYMKKFKMQSSDADQKKMLYKDHYEVLGINRDASHTEVGRLQITPLTLLTYDSCKYNHRYFYIRRAYRKLALKCHPDRRPSPNALERWEGVPVAYAVLSNPNDRTDYDATLPTRDALIEFYRAYNPSKLDNTTIETIIDGWAGREVELFEMLNQKYEVLPHKGIAKAVHGAAVMSISRERSHKVALDTQMDTSKDAATVEITWKNTIVSAFCCKNALIRCFNSFNTTYYVVDTTSPGSLATRGSSDTPGQAMPGNRRSPAPPSKLSKPLSPDFDLPFDAENSSTATTTDGSPPSGDECYARSRNEFIVS